ncbi:hypothetical protein Avbf_16443, partial [Armadillidium vulgare]
MKMKHWKFYPCKFSKICSDHFTPDCINQEKERTRILLKPKVNIISETGSGVKQLQDVNSQSFDCHNQPISKPANYLKQ